MELLVLPHFNSSGTAGARLSKCLRQHEFAGKSVNCLLCTRQLGRQLENWGCISYVRGPQPSKHQSALDSWTPNVGSVRIVLMYHIHCGAGPDMAYCQLAPKRLSEQRLDRQVPACHTFKQQV